ncbi:hypothetical protein GCM10011273_17700 [Asticcacaulis endophyticus]|uniref:Uncharacterized protein n=1 Tax=Asticcacaulis endophyticus TaxID=1395890 RepID=A0A918Q4U3_9CAUL|nr:hypothetical protein GCM10011273_17700 [Asticcacaulis endophyticus]
MVEPPIRIVSRKSFSPISGQNAPPMTFNPAGDAGLGGEAMKPDMDINHFVDVTKKVAGKVSGVGIRFQDGVDAV